MPDTKEFPTLHVASALTGICLCPSGFDGVKYAEVASWIIGFDLFTHELWDEEFLSPMRAAGYAQFPALPEKWKAEANHIAATDEALKAYGKTVMVAKGPSVRPSSPLDTMHVNKQRIIGIMVDKALKGQNSDG